MTIATDTVVSTLPRNVFPDVDDTPPSEPEEDVDEEDDDDEFSDIEEMDLEESSMPGSPAAVRQLITGGDPYAPFRFPIESTFEKSGAEYLPAPELERIGEALILSCAELADLRGAAIAWCWRRKGGKHCGKPILAKCQKVSGLTKFYASADFVISAAADFCRQWGPDHYQIEALIHHELCHGQVDPEDGRPSPAGHDAELFFANVKRYGFWQADLEAASDTFRQVGLGLA